MSQNNSTTPIQDHKFYDKIRVDAQCKDCGDSLKKGASAWWSQRAGWLCGGCRHQSKRTDSRNSINMTSVYRCVLVKESSIRFDGPALGVPESAGRFAAELLKNSPTEQLVAILLNTKNAVIGISVVSVGTLTASLVHPREVFRPAIIANAKSLIIAHNHPSGDLTPSYQDWQVFKSLRTASEFVGIQVLDSLIVNDNLEFLSMAEIETTR